MACLQACHIFVCEAVSFQCFSSVPARGWQTRGRRPQDMVPAAYINVRLHKIAKADKYHRR